MNDVAIAVNPRAREHEELTSDELERLTAHVALNPELGNVKAMRAAGIRDHYTNGQLKELLDDDVVAQLREVRGEPAKKALHVVAADPDHKHWPHAIRAVLPAYGGSEFQESSRVELTGRDGNPIEVQDRSASLDDVARVLEAVGALTGLGSAAARDELPAA